MSNKTNTHAPNKAKGFGLTAELAKKQAEKFDPDLTNSIIEWVKNVLEYKVPGDEHIKTLHDIQTMGEFEKMFKDGIVLAKLINCLYPGKVKKINKIDNPNSPFKKTKEQENIQNFIDFSISEGGCLKGDMFEFVDLYEAVNLISVIDGMAALGRKCHSHPDPSMPCFGPKEAEKNEREFTEEQLNAGKSEIGLQMGTNKCASQAGLNMGKTRTIMD